MQVSQACARYFTGFQEISNLRSQDCKTNTVALLKIASYCTLAIPIGVGIAYGISLAAEWIAASFKMGRRDVALRQAIDSAIPAGKAMWVEDCLDLAFEFHRLGKTGKAQEWINFAFFCAQGIEGRGWDYLVCLLSIASTQKCMQNETGAYDTVQTAIAKIPNLSDDASKAEMYAKCARFLYFDLKRVEDEARQIIELGNQVLEPYKDSDTSGHSWLISARRKLATALDPVICIECN